MIIAIVIDDMAFSSNSGTIMKHLYNKFKIEFGIKLFSQLQSFLGWIVAAVDVDWGGDADTRSSTTGFVVLVNGSPDHWRTELQTVIALSSGEAEYV
eukprot:IDg1411t1